MKNGIKLAAIGIGLLLLSLLAGSIGSAISHGAETTVNGAREISYADFIVIMLTGIAVLLAILAFVLAIAAYAGWDAISTKVANEVKDYLADGFQPGKSLHKILVEQKNKVPYDGTAPIDNTFERDAAAEADKDY